MLKVAEEVQDTGQKKFIVVGVVRGQMLDGTYSMRHFHEQRGATIEESIHSKFEETL